MALSPAAVGTLISVVVKLLEELMRRYGTDDPEAAARAHLRAMADQDATARKAQARLDARRKAGR